MKKILSMFFVGLLSVSFLACAAGDKKDVDKPGVVSANMGKITATVEAVDYDNRLVTLRGPQGRVLTLHVDKQAKNFKQVKTGDKVQAEYYESVALYVQKHDGTQPSVKEGTAVAVAPLGEKPGIAAVDTVVITATVEAIDYKTRMVTLKTPDGRSVTFEVDERAPDMKKVKVGDQVVAEHTVVVAISVKKQ